MKKRRTDESLIVSAGIVSGAIVRKGQFLVLILAFYGSLLSPAPVIALSSDRDLPINIEADFAEADNKARVRTYKGGVVISQGSLLLISDSVTMRFDEKDDLQSFVAIGEPAKFRQCADGKPDYQRAQANRIEYDAAAGRVVLTGNAKAWQGRDAINGTRIVYYPDGGRVQAETDVRITIEPKSVSRQRQTQSTDCPSAKSQ